MVEFGFRCKGVFGSVWSCWPADRDCQRIAWQKARDALDGIRKAEIEQRYAPLVKAIDVLDKVMRHPRP
jgi:hypothetical protein